MHQLKPFSTTATAAAIISVSAILMSAWAGSPGDGGDKRASVIEQIAAGDRKAVRRVFTLNGVKYGVDNFLQIAFHGQADFGISPSPPSQFAWLASCIDAHSGHLFIIDADGRIVLSKKTGCQRNVGVRDVNEDGAKELISNSGSGGTGFSSVWERYYFFDGKHFRNGLEFEKSSYETMPSSMIFSGTSDWRQDVWVLKEVKGGVEFLDVDRDGFKEAAKVSHTKRHKILYHDRDRHQDGMVPVRIREAVDIVFGEGLGVGKQQVEHWNWKPISNVYLKQ
jgi:hypothetical protein